MYLKIGRMKIALIIIFKIIVTKRLQTEKKLLQNIISY